jgi:hypothetical protein
VWLLVEGSDAKANADAAELLEKTSAKLAKEPAAGGHRRTGLETVLAAPLKISFATVRVSRTDPAERPFVAPLGHIFTDAARATGPVVVLDLGRGRALDVVLGDDLTAQTLTDAAVFLTGRCSCQVKRLNPGSICCSPPTGSRSSRRTRSTQPGHRRTCPRCLPRVAGTGTEMGTHPDAGAAPRVLLWSLGGAGVALVFGTALLLLRWRGGSAS